MNQDIVWGSIGMNHRHVESIPFNKRGNPDDGWFVNRGHADRHGDERPTVQRDPRTAAETLFPGCKQYRGGRGDFHALPDGQERAERFRDRHMDTSRRPMTPNKFTWEGTRSDTWIEDVYMMLQSPIPRTGDGVNRSVYLQTRWCTNYLILRRNETVRENNRLRQAEIVGQVPNPRPERQTEELLYFRGIAPRKATDGDPNDDNPPVIGVSDHDKGRWGPEDSHAKRYQELRQNRMFVAGPDSAPIAWCPGLLQSIIRNKLLDPPMSDMDGSMNGEYVLGPLQCRTHYGGLVDPNTSRDYDCLQSLRSAAISLDNDLWDPERLFIACKKNIVQTILCIPEEGCCAIRQNKIGIAFLQHMVRNPDLHHLVATQEAQGHENMGLWEEQLRQTFGPHGGLSMCKTGDFQSNQSGERPNGRQEQSWHDVPRGPGMQPSSVYAQMIEAFGPRPLIALLSPFTRGPYTDIKNRSDKQARFPLMDPEVGPNGGVVDRDQHRYVWPSITVQNLHGDRMHSPFHDARMPFHSFNRAPYDFTMEGLSLRYNHMFDSPHNPVPYQPVR